MSPALGGVVVGYEIGRQLKIETIFAERIDGKLVISDQHLVKNISVNQDRTTDEKEEKKE